MIPLNFGVEIEVTKYMGETMLVIDNNLPNSKWDQMRQVL